jgi:RNA recognition motif-containing protein
VVQSLAGKGFKAHLDVHQVNFKVYFSILHSDLVLLSAFGFCEYGSPDSGLRAVRLLHDFEIGGKKLVVKVDAKTKVVLDEYKGIQFTCRLNLVN